MYDLPELRQATDVWWHGLVGWWRLSGMADVPDRLTIPGELYAHWREPGLFISQTCGYPLTHELRGQVRLAATPCYGAPGCAGATYRSVILTHAASGLRDLAGLAGKRAAVNGFDSQSGWNVLRHALRGFGEARRFLGDIVVTGGHRASLGALAARQVDVAAADCVTFELLRRIAPREVQDLSILCWSDPAPSLPYITRLGADEKTLRPLRDGLQAACADPALSEVRNQLLLDGFSMLPLSAYDVILEQEAASGAGERQ